MSVTVLLRREPRGLAFGLVHTLAGILGQTFVISLFHRPGGRPRGIRVGIFCLHLVPLAADTAALATLQSAWIVPFFWFAAGVASRVGPIVQTSVAAERHRPGALRACTCGRGRRACTGLDNRGRAAGRETALGILATRTEGAHELRKTPLREGSPSR